MKYDKYNNNIVGFIKIGRKYLYHKYNNDNTIELDIKAVLDFFVFEKYRR